MEFLLCLIGLVCLVFTATCLIKEAIKDVKEKGFKARWQEVNKEEDNKAKGHRFFHLLFKLVCKMCMAVAIVVTAVLLVVGMVKKIIG